MGLVSGITYSEFTPFKPWFRSQDVLSVNESILEDKFSIIFSVSLHFRLFTDFSIFSVKSAKSLSEMLGTFPVVILEHSGLSIELVIDSRLAFLLEIRSGILFGLESRNFLRNNSNLLVDKGNAECKMLIVV